MIIFTHFDPGMHLKEENSKNSHQPLPITNALLITTATQPEFKHGHWNMHFFLNRALLLILTPLQTLYTLYTDPAHVSFGILTSFGRASCLIHKNKRIPLRRLVKLPSSPLPFIFRLRTWFTLWMDFQDIHVPCFPDSQHAWGCDSVYCYFK